MDDGGDKLRSLQYFYRHFYSIISINNKLEIRSKKQQLKELDIDTELVPIVANLNETSDDKFSGKKLINLKEIVIMLILNLLEKTLMI